jgi:hypothetical protein
LNIAQELQMKSTIRCLYVKNVASNYLQIISIFYFYLDFVLIVHIMSASFYHVRYECIWKDYLIHKR